MSGASKIEWTDATWNPLVGCERVSPGCDHCYAARYASRNLNETYRGLAAGGVFNGTVRLLPGHLEDPIRWTRSRRIFVNSMSDLFHPGVPDSFIAEVFARMGLAQHHEFQVLTKRPQRMATWASQSPWPWDWFEARAERAVSPTFNGPSTEIRSVRPSAGRYRTSGSGRRSSWIATRSGRTISARRRRRSGSSLPSRSSDRSRRSISPGSTG